MNPFAPKDLATRNVLFGLNIFLAINSVVLVAMAKSGGDSVLGWLLGLALGAIYGGFLVLRLSIRKKLQYTIYFLLSSLVLYALNHAVIAPHHLNRFIAGDRAPGSPEGAEMLTGVVPAA